MTLKIIGDWKTKETKERDYRCFETERDGFKPPLQSLYPQAVEKAFLTQRPAMALVLLNGGARNTHIIRREMTCAEPGAAGRRICGGVGVRVAVPVLLGMYVPVRSYL